MEPKFEFKASVGYETCWRCLDLGIPPETIQPGEPYVTITTKDKMGVCCIDCFNRLIEEVREEYKQDWNYE